MCMFCRCDTVKESTTTHVVNYNGCVIVIKNVPCEECVQCGEKFYTDEVAEQLEKMVDSAKKLMQEISVIDYSKVAQELLYSREDSDVDIVALVRGNREKLQEQIKIVWDQTYDLGLDYDVVLSPAVIPYEEFKRYQEVLPYYRNIAIEGVNIVA